MDIAAMCNIAALVQEGTYNRAHVLNMIAGNIRRDIDRRLANAVLIRPWSRLSPDQECVVTAGLFDKVLKRGTLAFEQINGFNINVYIRERFCLIESLTRSAI